jgi:hypothetical protein
MNTLPLDPTIAALADQSGTPADPVPWDAMQAATGITREHYFAALASRLLMAGEHMIAGYLARPDRASGARHRAYSAGAIRAPKRAKAMTDGEKFGLHTKAVA